MKVGLAVLAGALVLAGCSQSRPLTVVAVRSTPIPKPTLSIARSTAPAAAPVLIQRVQWGRTSKGRQLQVFPTPAGRTDDAPDAAARAWAEILSDAPNANTPGMHDQFLCHWNFARIVEPDKPSWNLEPWRLALGYDATVAALCNPGGSDG